MILDSSSVVSVLFKERGHERLAEAMAGAGDLGIGAPTLVETGTVMIGCMGLGARGLLARFLEQRRVLVIPFDDRHWNAAAQAFIRYGKGRHPAALNYGECMTYATARIAGAPLLYAGEDFAKTDLWSALD